MRRSLAFPALVLGSALVLTACGSDDGDGGSDDPTPEAATCVTTAGTGLEAGDPAVTASGSFGEKPELEIPAEDPSGELVMEVLAEGDGDPVGACDFVTVNYLGQTWEPGEGGEVNVFDNSFDREEPFRFAVGVGKVIQGWDAALIGQRTGSRVLVVIPPEQAYGASDGHDLQEDTLVFVVDIVDRIPENAGISGEPVAGLADDLPIVTGEGASEPVVEFPESAAAVEESDAVLLVEGDGAEFEDVLVTKVLQVSYLTSETQFSTWGQGPLELTSDMLPGLAEVLEGQKVGSRVLVRISAADNPTAEDPEGEPIAIVLDVIGTY